MCRPLLLLTVTTLLAGSPLTIAAQTVRVSGILSDASTGSPVSAATLELAQVDSRTVTDSAGGFVLQAVPPGRYLLRVRHVGYGTHEDSLTVGRNDVSLAIRISPQAIELEPLRVEASARERSETSRAYVITRAQIESVLGRARHLGDVVRTFIPGATVYETRAGYVCLEFRGARGARTRGCNFPLVVVDDVPIPGPAQFLRDTPPEDIERIEFVPASAGAGRYGIDSQYGALVIRTRRSGVAAAAEADVRAGNAAERSSAFPSYDWTREQAGHPWERSGMAAAAGTVLGTVAGLAALGCFGSTAEGTDCVTGNSVGAGLAALILPVAGATVGANLFGATDRSRGKPVHAAIAAAIPMIVGFAMYRDGETAEFGTSRVIGGALVIGVAPLAATIADGLFRSARQPNDNTPH